MLLAVAGLDEAAVQEHTRRLAQGDWSGFSAADQLAFAFARKQAQSASSITPSDVEELIGQLGRERAMDVIWWSCRCAYMTRVADALGLPLERENVFTDYGLYRK